MLLLMIVEIINFCLLVNGLTSVSVRTSRIANETFFSVNTLFFANLFLREKLVGWNSLVTSCS